MIQYPHMRISWGEQERFVEPISTPDDLSRVLALLAHRLGARLEARRLGGRSFVAHFLRVDGVVPEIGIATTLPLRDPLRITRLLQAKLEQVDPGFGIEAVILQACEVVPLREVQAEMASIEQDSPTELAEAIDQIANRLGLAALWQDAPQASHIPERSVMQAGPLAPPPSWPSLAPQRPLRLLAPPEPIEATAMEPDEPPIQFRWRGALHRVRAASLPERIAVEWWRRTPDESRIESDLLRDYYRVEDAQGARFWLFRAGLNTPARQPRWFLHGVFG